MENLVVDFDGTKHNTIKIYFSAFQKTYQYIIEKRNAGYCGDAGHPSALWIPHPKCGALQRRNNSLPFRGTWAAAKGGVEKATSHSWGIQTPEPACP